MDEDDEWVKNMKEIIVILKRTGASLVNHLQGVKCTKGYAHGHHQSYQAPEKGSSMTILLDRRSLMQEEA